MSEQGAMAQRYANCGDDENSQAEGLSDGLTRNAQDNNTNQNASNNNNQPRNPHYENIYESIDRYAANVPAENPNAQIANNNNNNNNSNNSNNINRINSRNSRGIYYHNASILNQRAGAYDVPRQALRSNNHFSSNPSTVNRRINMNYDTNPNRARYINTNRTTHRQRSFDDTESYHYSHGNNFRCENIYEQIREEPIYRNVTMTPNNNRVYGRLDVIGHGIGRIERHLSSSCGNIDHYNLGGHYAILGHSHLGTVGHIRLNAANSANNAKETGGKSLNFFSCLGRENSQSMTNICRESTNPIPNATESKSTPSTQHGTQQNENSSGIQKHTGAIPKIKNKVAAIRNTQSPAPVHSTAFNRIPKSSLQWLLVNKWLPLWIGNGSDCNVLDFNFMFSRNCEGCGRDSSNHNMTAHDDANRDLYANYPKDLNARCCNAAQNTLRSMHFNENLLQFNEIDRRRMLHNEPHHLRSNEIDGAFEANSLSRNAMRNARRDTTTRREHDNLSLQPQAISDPFRRWELNSENNSFRPAIRRITDGTLPQNNLHNQQVVRVEINHHSPESAEAGPSNANAILQNTDKSNKMPSTSGAHLRRPERRAFENSTLSSSTESASESENKVLSPDLSGRRYSENTEDDQYNTNSTASSTEEEDVGEDNTEDSVSAVVIAIDPNDSQGAEPNENDATSNK